MRAITPKPSLRIQPGSEKSVSVADLSRPRGIAGFFSDLNLLKIIAEVHFNTISLYKCGLNRFFRKYSFSITLSLYYIKLSVYYCHQRPARPLLSKQPETYRKIYPKRRTTSFSLIEIRKRCRAGLATALHDASAWSRVFLIDRSRLLFVSPSRSRIGTSLQAV
jgi:hypothetical protein